MNLTGLRPPKDAQVEAFAGLTELHLDHNELDDGSGEALAASPHLGQLTHLSRRAARVAQGLARSEAMA